MTERFECTTLAKKRYINTLPFLFLYTLPVDTGVQNEADGYGT